MLRPVTAAATSPTVIAASGAVGDAKCVLPVLKAAATDPTSPTCEFYKRSGLELVFSCDGRVSCKAMGIWYWMPMLQMSFLSAGLMTEGVPSSMSGEQQ
jgi:hypothetical protein